MIRATCLSWRRLSNWSLIALRKLKFLSSIFRRRCSRLRRRLRSCFVSIARRLARRRCINGSSASLWPEDLAILFVARLADPIHFNSSLCTFTLVDIAFAFGQVQVGAPVTLTDYPLAPETSVGKMMPIVVGDVARVPAVPVRKVAETRVRSVVLSGGSSVTVADTTDFPASGSIVINDDVIAYTSKNSTQFWGVRGSMNFITPTTLFWRA